MKIDHPLHRYMHFLSVKYFGQAWFDGLEYFLWNCRLKGSGLEGMELYELERLAFRYDGWFVWSNEEGKAVFAPMHEWLLDYEEEMGSEDDDD